MIILHCLYLIFISEIVLHFLHNTSVLSFYIDVVLTLSPKLGWNQYWPLLKLWNSWDRRAGRRTDRSMLRTFWLHLTLQNDVMPPEWDLYWERFRVLLFTEKLQGQRSLFVNLPLESKQKWANTLHNQLGTTKYRKFLLLSFHAKLAQNDCSICPEWFQMFVFALCGHKTVHGKIKNYAW